MSSNFYAVLIGFNEYKDRDNLPALQFAEKDARDMYDLLVHPEIGNFPAENILLLPGTSTTDEIEKYLHQHIRKDRVEEDTVLVFYSGHGFIAGDDKKAYLATPDVSIMDILNNPRAGLQMEYIHNDIFMRTKAKCAIFLLDCCHSGAFVPNFNKSGDGDPSQKSIVSSQQFLGQGRVAFVSSPRGITSRESREFQNGIFTHYLINGLKGAAVDLHTGEVTMSSLVSYVQNMAPASQPPVRYGQEIGKIILTKPNIKYTAPSGYVAKPYQELKASGSTHNTLDVLSLDNPLEHRIGYINQLLDCVKGIGQEENVALNTRILSAIRCSLDADLVFVQRVNADDSMIPKGDSDFPFSEIDLTDFRDMILSGLYPMFGWNKPELLSKRFGFSIPYPSSKETNKNIVVVPLRIEKPREYLILCGLRPDQLQFGEILGHTLSSLYKATGELTSLDLLQTETIILDDLKSDYGYLPYEVYKRRFSLYKERLKNITFYFEPVIHLGKKDMEIDSWESLARDPETGVAPVDMFHAAELWGSEFTTELDLHCLRNSLVTYDKVWREEHHHQKKDPLSINVYPATLFRKVYLQELTRLIREEELIHGSSVILEISEKRPIPKPDEDMPPEMDEVDIFAKKLNEYTTKLNIGFAIDDFGVGHSSVSRVARLNLAHVKIDREVLHHDHPESTIRYVLEQVSQGHTHSKKVVVEGFDGDSHIPLAALYRLGIEYIQGHIVRRASRTPFDLEPEKRDFLMRLVAEG